MKLIVTIPAFNEEAAIADVIDRWAEASAAKGSVRVRTKEKAISRAKQTMSTSESRLETKWRLTNEFRLSRAAYREGRKSGTTEDFGARCANREAPPT